jgi:hypothetical protein
MYKVIDKVTGNRLTVEAIDASKHLHITGVEFTAEQLASLPTVSKKAPKVEEIVEEVAEEVVEPKKTGKGKK